MVDWTKVQEIQTTTASGTATNTISFGGAAVAGHGVFGRMLLSSGHGGIVSITDNAGNSYISACGYDDGTLCPVGFYPDPDINNGFISGSPTTVSVVTVNVPTVFWCDISEWTPPTGAPGISVDGIQILSNSATASFPPLQTLNNDVLLLAAGYPTTSVATGAGWTADAGSGTQQCYQHLIQATANAAINTVFATLSGSLWGLVFGIAPIKRNTWCSTQGVYNHSGSTGTSISASFGRAIKNGSYVFGMFANQTSVAGNDTSNLTSFTDDKSVTYTVGVGAKTFGPNFNGRTLWMIGPFNNGAKTLTANVGASSTGLFLSFEEFRPPPGTGAVSLDGYAEAQPAGGTSGTVGPITTTKAGDLLISMMEPSAGAALPTTSDTALQGINNTWALGYRIAGAAGNYSSSWSCASSAINMYLAGFAALPAGGGQSMWTSQQGYMMRFL